MPAQQQERLTKRQRRVLRQQGILDTDNQLSSGFTVKSDIAPMTDNQASAFESWDEGQNLMLHGIAGTGKTFLALYFALKETAQESLYCSINSSNKRYRISTWLSERQDESL